MSHEEQFNLTENKAKSYKNISIFKAEKCPFCESKEIVKCGFRYNHTTKKQRYKCNSCKRLFVVNDGFFKMKKQRELITTCLNLYMNGMSLRKITDHINQFEEVKVSYRTILNWIIRYARIIKPFTEKLDFKLSRIYHTDEIFLKCNKEQHYFWNTLDKGTRMLVATHYSTKRDGQSAKRLFLKTKYRPLTQFTDGLQGYRKAIKKVYGTRYKTDKVKYIRLKADKDKRNNIAERIQGTIRERVKVMRGFKNKESAKLILDLFVIYYNFIRIHQGIRMTPVQKAGIDLKLGKNRWLDLIYKSTLS